MRFNSDSGSNYSRTILYGTGSTAGSARSTGATEITISTMPTTSQGYWTMVRANVMNYSNATTYKTVLNRADLLNDAALEVVGLWRNTSAITSITLSSSVGSLAAGSIFTIYGIAAASVGAKATGGTIYSDASYYYHVFNASGTFTPTQSISADMLVIAGGGGGGGTNIGGGGGAGGVSYFSSQSLTATGYTCTVGAGGTGGAIGVTTPGTNGANSQFGALTASVGGGGGAASVSGNGLDGGSGGGSGNGTNTGGVATSGQGYAGGSNSSGYGLSGGGGGGAGGAGEAARADGNASAGGIGTATYSSWGTVTGMGHNVSGTYYFAGGGACGAAITTYGKTPVTTRSYGGGGAYGTGLASGLPNTGSGGTGSSFQDIAGGSGGSGLIIVRYAK
jgi:hypothetical protein